MAVFDIRKRLIRDYRDYVESIIQTRDSRIHAHVHQLLDEGELCPEGLIQADPILVYPAQDVGWEPDFGGYIAQDVGWGPVFGGHAAQGVGWGPVFGGILFRFQVERGQ